MRSFLSRLAKFSSKAETDIYRKFCSGKISYFTVYKFSYKAYTLHIDKALATCSV